MIRFDYVADEFYVFTEGEFSLDRLHDGTVKLSFGLSKEEARDIVHLIQRKLHEKHASRFS